MKDPVIQCEAIEYTGDSFIFTDDMRDEFFENGFLVVENVFSKEEMDSAIAATDEELSKAFVSGRYDWPLHRLNAARNLAIRSLCQDPRLVKILQPILGNDIQLQHSKFAVKQPGQGRGTINWHQDFAFLPHTNDSLVSIGISLTDITPENGAMLMVRGSHKYGLLNHRREDGTFAEECLATEVLNNKKEHRWICPKVGGISIHHCLTAHSSGDNSSENSRYLLVFEYRAADAYRLADGIWDDTGLQISGKPAQQVRLGGRFLQRESGGDINFMLPVSQRYGTDFPFGHAYNQYGEVAKQNNPLFFKNDQNDDEKDSGKLVQVNCSM